MKMLPASYTRELENGTVVPYSMFSSLLRYRYALWSLMLKDFRVRYRNMSLGMLWSIINPLVMLGVLVVVFSFIHPNHHVKFFPVFMLIGLVIYNFLSISLPPACSAIMDNASLVKKVIFPRELIPVAVIFAQLIHAGIQLLLLVVFVLVFSVPLHVTWLWVPAVYLIMTVFVLGLGFGCAALNVKYRDMQYVVDSALKVVFWLTPIFYDLGQVKLNLPRPLYLVYIMNPMAGCIDAMRRTVILGTGPDPESLLIAAVMAVLTLLGGFFIFHRQQARFADRL